MVACTNQMGPRNTALGFLECYLYPEDRILLVPRMTYRVYIIHLTQGTHKRTSDSSLVYDRRTLPQRLAKNYGGTGIDLADGLRERPRQPIALFPARHRQLGSHAATVRKRV